jgi:hypothetical protein
MKSRKRDLDVSTPGNSEGNNLTQGPLNSDADIDLL